MKNLLIVPVLTLALAGCAGQSAVTGGTGTISIPTPTQVGNTIAEVQAVTSQICSFVPTAQTVASILDVLGVPGISTATNVAAQICSAVTAVSTSRGRRATPRVHGVAIKGRFVR